MQDAKPLSVPLTSHFKLTKEHLSKTAKEHALDGKGNILEALSSVL